MAFLNCSFYELLKPPIDEIVLVEFNTYEEMNIKGKLVEYNNAVFSTILMQQENVVFLVGKK